MYNGYSSEKLMKLGYRVLHHRNRKEYYDSVRQLPLSKGIRAEFDIATELYLHHHDLMREYEHQYILQAQTEAHELRKSEGLA